jgi:hypothetical protein
MSSTLQRMAQIKIVTVLLKTNQGIPDDHLCRFTGTQNDLPLKLVTLRDSKFLHRADRTLIHV